MLAFLRRRRCRTQAKINYMDRRWWVAERLCERAAPRSACEQQVADRGLFALRSRLAPELRKQSCQDPLRAHPRRSRCLMLRFKPDVRKGPRLLQALLERPSLDPMPAQGYSRVQ